MPLRLTETVKKMLILWVGIFILQNAADQFASLGVKGWLALIPNEVLSGKIWQLFTYQFLHGDVMHLVLNGLIFAFMGPELEMLWGTRRFLQYFFICGTFAGFFYLLIQLLIGNPMYLGIPMVGASGGIYGLLLAYGILFKDRQMLLMMLFPVKAFQFIWVLAGIEFLQAVFSGQSGLSAIAHLSGMGAGYLELLRRSKGISFSFPKGSTKSKSQKSSHLRLVKDADSDSKKSGPKTWH